MKYALDSRQNCRPQRVRRISTQATRVNPTTLKANTLATHSRLASHSFDQSVIGSTASSQPSPQRLGQH